MAVFVLISSNGCLIGLYTSPVDSAQMQKQHPGSTVTRCLLNAEVSVSEAFHWVCMVPYGTPYLYTIQYNYIYSIQSEFRLREQASHFPVRTNKLAELIGENGEIPFSIISVVTVARIAQTSPKKTWPESTQFWLSARAIHEPEQ